MIKFLLFTDDESDKTVSGIQEYLALFDVPSQVMSGKAFLSPPGQESGPQTNISQQKNDPGTHLIAVIQDTEVGKELLKLIHSIRSTSGYEEVCFLLITPEPAPQVKDSFFEELNIMGVLPPPIKSSVLIPVIKKAIEIPKNYHEASSLRQKIQTLLNTEDSGKELMEAIEKLAVLNHTSPVYLQYLKARALEKMGSYKEAIIAANDAISKNQNFLPGWSVLASIYQRSGDADAAKRSLVRALKIATEHVDYLVQLGDIHFEEGEFRESETFYRRALKRSPDHLSARAGQVAVSLATGEKPSQDDLSYFPSSLELARISNLKGIELSRSSQFTSAQKLYENALTFLPIADQAHKVLFNMGLLMERAQKYDEAVKYYEESITRASPEPLPKAISRLEALRARTTDPQNVKMTKGVA